MPSQKARSRRRSRSSPVPPAIILILCAVAAVLVVMLVRSDPLGNGKKDPVRYPDELMFSEITEAKDIPLVLRVETTPAPGEIIEPEEVEAVEVSVTPEPVVEAAGEAQSAPDNRFMPAPERDDFLPVLNRALRTPDDEMMIAVTVDDCNDPDVLTEVVRIAQKYGAKLTLFPTGDTLMMSGMAKGFRTCVRSYGYEIENHTFGHKAEYRLSDSEMALQIWKGGLAESYAMGADYKAHFFRPYNRLSVRDQRTHYLCDMLGYVGIAGYTYSYKDFDTVDELLKTLTNGYIYQFDMKEESMAMFEDFLKGANKKGFKMVTLNTLVGIEANGIGNSLNLDKEELPSMRDYPAPLYDLNLGDRTHAVYTLQTRLRQLGYLTTVDEEGEARKADGIYGTDTSIAVSAFQGAVGLAATGNADVATLERLYAEDAPLREGYVLVEY